jgi:hypothetical protein
MDFDRPTLQQRVCHLTGQPVDFDLRPFRDLVAALEPEVEDLDDEDIRTRAQGLRGSDLDGALVKVFALVREASKRCLGQRPCDEQISRGPLRDVSTFGCLTNWAARRTFCLEKCHSIVLLFKFAATCVF